MSETVTSPARTYEVVRETWLTRKPRPSAFFVSALSTLALCIGSIIYLRAPNWGESMSASWKAVHDKGEYWRLWTTIFAHGDFGHLVSNTFLFFILGFFLYGYFGTAVFPIGAFILGGLTNYIVLSTYAPEITLIGASGVVYWMGGAWLILYFLLSRQKNFNQRLLRTLGVGILIFMPAEAFEARVSYRTHLIGFVLGVVFGLVYFLLYRRRFREAEVRETVTEELDPGDDLPPPEGFPV